MLDIIVDGELSPGGEFSVSRSAALADWGPVPPASYQIVQLSDRIFRFSVSGSGGDESILRGRPRGASWRLRSPREKRGRRFPER